MRSNGRPGARQSALTLTKDLRRAGFPFRSGALCLDFVATVAKRGMGDREMLAGPEQLDVWLRAADLGPAAQPITEGDVGSARVLREAVHELTRALLGGYPPSVVAIDTVNAAATPGCPPVLIAGDGRTPLLPRPAPLESLLAVVARDAVELFTGPLRGKVRACTGHDCSLYFVDRSRPGTRRWCTMAACGEKASSATYRRRHAHPPPA